MKDRGKTIGVASGAVGLGGSAALLGACCLGPWGVTLLGALGAVTVARYSYLQPYLLAGAVALLGVAFWFAYRPLPSCADQTCPASSRTALRWVAWIAAALVLIFGGLACLANWA